MNRNILIGLGVLLLLWQLGVLPANTWALLWRFWPVILIAIGAWMLWKRTSASPPTPPNAPPQEGPQP